MLALLLGLRIVQQLVDEVCGILNVFLTFLLHALHRFPEVVQLVESTLGVGDRFSKLLLVLLSRSFILRHCVGLNQCFEFLFDFVQLALELVKIDLFVIAFA